MRHDGTVQPAARLGRSGKPALSGKPADHVDSLPYRPTTGVAGEHRTALYFAELILCRTFLGPSQRSIGILGF